MIMEKKLFGYKLYDILKYADLVFIPALITFYGVIGNVCHIPHTEVVLTIMGAFDVFLGSLIGVSSNNYQDEDVEEKVKEKAE